ncbi:YoaK family protein [Mycobacterium angelicum]|uniref:DUF1275 family protein n=1 Tax=Mycobacterium angelicum TaxID=470074 RepID=A0A1W9ZP14_MYCAN|nr:YoaK family protein [Mycobacterium angelicum]MCV7199122.1 DUF1275 domain-containing protein [Mycobacterium angelicum]ORA19587.1 hypothetical protein BST12_16690 [Mycobacterium angelicum]
MREIRTREARLLWVLTALSGLLGATALTQTVGYFVTFMTGNARVAVVGLFKSHYWLSASGAMLMASFLGGVVLASLCRRHLWVGHPHSPTALTTLFLIIATAIDAVDGVDGVTFVSIVFVAFALGAMNTSFVRDGEVTTPVSYVTGTLVKFGQGIERHISGGSASDWLGYILQFTSYTAGATIGGCISLVANGSQMLAAATAASAAITVYTFRTNRVEIPNQRQTDAVEAQAL